MLADRIVVLSPPPSTVLEVVDVRDIDGPSDPGYLETQARLHTMLGATDEERADVQN
jgi:NitT/TauT family transport system ATP-binding protein